MRKAKIIYRSSELDRDSTPKEICEIQIEVWRSDDIFIQLENRKKIVCIPWDVIAAIEIDKS